MTTLDEIAKLANVSRSTVSRVINNEPRVSEETRKRVWSCIRENDFRPNIAARALAGGRSQTISFVIQPPYRTLHAEPYFAMLIQVITAACEDQGFYLMLALAPTNAPKTLDHLIQGGHQDGFILYYSCLDDINVQHLAKQNVPFVLLGHAPSGIACHSVDFDNVHGAELIAHHLARLGYKRMAMITGPTYAFSSIDRLEGFRTGLRAHGLDCPDEYIAEGDYTDASGNRAMKRLLSMSPRPQAVFAANDTMAFGAMQAVRAAHLSIPEDIAIVGFDDVPLAAVSEPALTTVRQPPEAMGEAAVTLLVNQLVSGSDGNKLPSNVILPVDLIIRESCGARLIRGTPPGTMRTNAQEVVPIPINR